MRDAYSGCCFGFSLLHLYLTNDFVVLAVVQCHVPSPNCHTLFSGSQKYKNRVQKIILTRFFCFQAA
ncbi:MAG: hypothetical protein Q4B82_00010 [Alysiella sp.]|uniref:hypothetical protein n=1 Tax=Alysiella sp. TaxID=1872483 RepID=UPI0026DC4343|nr:hypothetical protein [Alysiella sp.]MDO4432951.1 hypothetical protein [Alysiella sp.]